MDLSFKMVQGSTNLYSITGWNEDSNRTLSIINIFKLHRDNILRWLNFLRVHHLGYRAIEIERANIDRLPQDSNVMDDVLIEELGADDMPPPETVAIPNLLASEEELGVIRRQLDVPALAILLRC